MSTRLLALSRLTRWLALMFAPTLMLLVVLVARAAAAPVGQITEFSAGLQPGSRPSFIAPGPDGNMWFTDRGVTNRDRGPGSGCSPCTRVRAPGRCPRYSSPGA
jgi:streptogramin lyase